MLTLTEQATTVIQTITAGNGAPDGAGVRISQEDQGSAALALTVTEAPQPGDQVVEEKGARLFLEETAAQTLDDKVLDASVDDQGGVEFSIVPQSVAPSPNGQVPPQQ